MFGDEDSEVVSTPGKDSPYRTPLRDISNEPPNSSQSEYFDENNSILETPQVKDSKRLQMHPTIDIQLINQKLERIKDEIKREVEKRLEQMKSEYQQELQIIKEQFLKNEKELEKERFEKRELEAKCEALENRLKSLASSKETSADELAQELIKQAREMQWLQETPAIQIKEPTRQPSTNNSVDDEDEENVNNTNQYEYYHQEVQPPHYEDNEEDDEETNEGMSHYEETNQLPSFNNNLYGAPNMHNMFTNNQVMPPMMIPQSYQNQPPFNQLPNQFMPVPASSMDFQINNSFYPPSMQQYPFNNAMSLPQSVSLQPQSQHHQFTYNEENVMVDPVRPPLSLSGDNYFERELASPLREEVESKPIVNTESVEEKKKKDYKEVKGIYQYTTILQQLNLKSDKKTEPAKPNVKKTTNTNNNTKKEASKKKSNPPQLSLKERVQQWKKEEKEKEEKFTNQQELLEIYFNSKMKGTSSCERLRNIVLHTYQMWNNLNIAFTDRERFMDEHVLKPISQAGKKSDSRWVMNEEYIANISGAFINEYNRLSGMVQQNGSIYKLIGEREQTKMRLDSLKQMEKPPVSEFSELTSLLKKLNTDVSKVVSEWEVKNSSNFILRGFRYLDLIQYENLVQKEEIEENERKALQNRIRRSFQ